MILLRLLDRINWGGSLALEKVGLDWLGGLVFARGSLKIPYLRYAMMYCLLGYRHGMKCCGI
jgi:hypothetical protein